MQDHEVVAAIVAGDPDGLAEAYDRYAASLYAYCNSVLAGPEAAAEAVRDTFIVAVSRLDGLRDPDRLGRWLQAVARNECLRRLGPTDTPPAPLVTTPGGAPSPGPTIVTGTPKPSASPSPASSSPSPSPSPTTSPSQGYLLVAPAKLMLASVKGSAASGTFVLTALNGPVSTFTIRVAAGMASNIKVRPSSGSLPANGRMAVTVTVTSKVALNTHVIVDPGNIMVTVVLTIKP